MRLWVLGGALALCASQAQALNYQLQYSDFAGSIVANLFVTLDADGGVATGISGTRNGETVTGLSDFLGSDNTLSVNSPFVSFNGLSYSVASGQSFNLFSLVTFDFEVGSANQDRVAIVNVSVTPSDTPPPPPPPPPSSVPEPASWAMMVAGFGVVGSALRRRRVRVTFA